MRNCWYSLLYGVGGVKGLVIQDGDSGADPAVHRLEGLVLTFVRGDDHHWTHIQPIEGSGHQIEGLRGNQRSLVHRHHVKFVEFEVDVRRQVPIDWDVKGCMNGVGFQIVPEDGSVTLGQEGHRCRQEDF